MELWLERAEQDVQGCEGFGIRSGDIVVRDSEALHSQSDAFRDGFAVDI